MFHCYRLKMLAMERKIVFVVLATSIISSGRPSNAFVPRNYGKGLANLADKYGKILFEQNINTRSSGV